MDRSGMKILPVVTAKSDENSDRRKGKVFSAMFFSRELVDPNYTRNSTCRKGNPVNIPEPYKYSPQGGAIGLTPRDISCGTVVPFKHHSNLEMRKAEKGCKVL